MVPACPEASPFLSDSGESTVVKPRARAARLPGRVARRPGARRRKRRRPDRGAPEVRALDFSIRLRLRVRRNLRGKNASHQKKSAPGKSSRHQRLLPEVFRPARPASRSSPWRCALPRCPKRATKAIGLGRAARSTPWTFPICGTRCLESNGVHLGAGLVLPPTARPLAHPLGAHSSKNGAHDLRRYDVYSQGRSRRPSRWLENRVRHLHPRPWPPCASRIAGRPILLPKECAPSSPPSAQQTRNGPAATTATASPSPSTSANGPPSLLTAAPSLLVLTDYTSAPIYFLVIPRQYRS